MKKNILRFAFLTLSTVFILGLNAQISTNRNLVSLEYNLLFRADTRYSVSVSPTNAIDAKSLFDGYLMPYYTSFSPSAANPIVIEIGNLPQIHTQAKAMVGWTTRYSNPVRFKIEGYGTWGTARWITLADYSNTDYNNFEFVSTIAEAQGNIFTKLRFTFYKGSGANGTLGLSELFFIHPEACAPYEGLSQGEELKARKGGTEGGRVTIENPSKTGTGQASTWKIFNMSGSYGNSLQFWAYDNIGCSGGLCTPRLVLMDNGNVGIGVSNPGTKLDVAGVVRAHEVRVCLNQGCDFVFEPDYQLMPLGELEKFVTTNKHLPEVAPAVVMESEGIDLSEMNAKLLQKVEELTLYVIQQQKEIDKLNIAIQELQTQNK